MNDSIHLRYCNCADPENCTQPLIDLVCRRGHVRSYKSIWRITWSSADGSEETIAMDKMNVAQIIEEPWSTYKLDDGTIVKIKLIVSDVYKFPQPDPATGLPQFLVTSSNVMTVEPSTTQEMSND